MLLNKHIPFTQCHGVYEVAEPIYIKCLLQIANRNVYMMNEIRVVQSVY